MRKKEEAGKGSLLVANHEQKLNRESWEKMEEGKRSASTKAAAQPFLKGDAVWIYPLKRMGVVYRPADERGNVVVQVQGQKLTFNQKRMKLYIPKTKLYPDEQYDLDIIFESKADRKSRKLMSRKHVEGLTIVTPEEKS